MGSGIDADQNSSLVGQGSQRVVGASAAAGAAVTQGEGAVPQVAASGLGARPQGAVRIVVVSTQVGGSLFQPHFHRFHMIQACFHLHAWRLFSVLQKPQASLLEWLFSF